MKLATATESRISSFTDAGSLRLCVVVTTCQFVTRLNSWATARPSNPDEPISATLSVSFPSANALRSMARPPRIEPPTTAAEVVLRKLRRLI